MVFIAYENSKEFAGKAMPYLQDHEDLFSLFYGVLEAIHAGRYKDPLMATIEDGEDILALVQMTPPHPLNLIFIEESKINECIEEIVTQLITREIEINSIVSLKPWAFTFVKVWEEKTGDTFEIAMDQGLYRLDGLNSSLLDSPGFWRYATEKDQTLLERWFTLFEEETGLPRTPIEQVRERLEFFIQNREVFVWVHKGRVVSMMKKNRPTRKGITVSLVFTPKEERKKGYARTLVAKVSEELLKDYDFCVLYTDMLNPTSNKIYQEIGYKKIADSVMLKRRQDKLEDI